jgi:hypothetical protein
MPMGGWITWLGALGTAILGVVDIINGNTEAGIQKLVAAVAIVGIGRKIEKPKNN